MTKLLPKVWGFLFGTLYFFLLCGTLISSKSSMDILLLLVEYRYIAGEKISYDILKCINFQTFFRVSNDITIYLLVEELCFG